MCLNILVSAIHDVKIESSVLLGVEKFALSCEAAYFLVMRGLTTHQQLKKLIDYREHMTTNISTPQYSRNLIVDYDAFGAVAPKCRCMHEIGSSEVHVQHRTECHAALW